jgi:hypothetical protein
LTTASQSVVVLADSDSGKGSPIGLFVVLLLIIAVYFLYRSMSGHLRRLPEKFPADDRPGAAPPTGTAPSADAPRAAADGEQPGSVEPS